MARLSGDERVDGRLVNGFDYDLQVWVLAGIIQDCGHPSGVHAGRRGCCNARLYSGRSLPDVLADRGIQRLKAEVR